MSDWRFVHPRNIQKVEKKDLIYIICIVFLRRFSSNWKGEFDMIFTG